MRSGNDMLNDGNDDEQYPIMGKRAGPYSFHNAEMPRNAAVMRTRNAATCTRCGNLKLMDFPKPRSANPRKITDLIKSDLVIVLGDRIREWN